MNQCIGYNSIIRTNGTVITYAYNILDDNGNTIKPNAQESFVLLPTDTDLINANNTILKAINNRLNPPILTGAITIQYIDENGTLIESAIVQTGLVLGTYIFQAKDFSGQGYVLIGDAMQTIILSENNLNQIVTFKYAAK
ncbi:MAG: MucBP domain-containing protein [Bacillota bacterium]|nr:MucBP domain-containing protein [Bacillota bacterium]